MFSIWRHGHGLLTRVDGGAGVSYGADPITVVKRTLIKSMMLLARHKNCYTVDAISPYTLPVGGIHCKCLKLYLPWKRPCSTEIATFQLHMLGRIIIAKGEAL